jgi:ketosteroid isomerase-like protein
MFGGYAIVLAVAMFLIVGVCASALAQEDAEAIFRALWDQYTLATETGDIELIMSLWDENGVKMGPDAPPVIGKEGIRAMMESLYAAFDWECPIVQEEAVIAGDWGFSRITVTLSGTPKGGGDTITWPPAKCLDIFKRQADGSWKLYIDCYNFDAPPPAAKRAGTSRGAGLAKPAQEDAEAIVREIYDRYELSVKTGDIDLHMSFWDDNGIKMSPGAPALIGKEGIRALMEGILGASDEEAPYVLDEAEIAGDWAFGRATWTLFQTPKEGGATTTFRLSSLDIFKRQADGSWKLYIDCWNFHGPPTITSVEATSWGQVKGQLK